MAKTTRIFEVKPKPSASFTEVLKFIHEIDCEMEIALYIAMTKMIFNKDHHNDMLRWCEKLYDIEGTFDPKIQEIALENMMNILSCILIMAKTTQIIQVKPKPSASFTEVLRLIHEIDCDMGIFLFKDSEKQQTKKEKFKEAFQRLLWPRHALTLTIFVCSTLIIRNFELVSIILSFSFSATIIELYIAMTKMINSKDLHNDMLRWCEKLYDVKHTFDPKIQEIALII
uniref:CSON012288 protein n=1 Tax=Culicoides sonorensis TaxID=179676 RepID=A0A336K2X1_CULSO